MNSNKFSNAQVLLIDDSEIDILVNRRLMELTYFSKNVLVTGSAEEALHFLKDECRGSDDAPDWIFLDIHLPGKSGYDFINEFALLPDAIKNKSRIIILSVFQKQEHLEKAMEHLFVYGQLDKPLTQQALRDLASADSNKVNASF